MNGCMYETLQECQTLQQISSIYGGTLCFIEAPSSLFNCNNFINLGLQYAQTWFF